MPDTENSRIEQALVSRFGGEWTARPLNGSTFFETWQARGPDRNIFLKTGAAALANALTAEEDGLNALAATGTVRVPEVFSCWIDPQSRLALLALEWLDLSTPDRNFGERFGSALAALHVATLIEGNGRYGWRRDNMIGATPQVNCWSATSDRAGWIDFFVSQRLLPMQRSLATTAPAALLNAIDAVIERLPALFAIDDHEPRASLIHGDLWSGNWGMLKDGRPAIYDPAVACCDAEAELAMMELFGSPPAGFWSAYRARARVAAGYEQRRALYQLYHLLNHALLFGGSYVQQSLSVAQRLAMR